MSDVVEFLASRLRSLTPEKWDAFVRSLDQRFRVLEEQLGIERRVTDQILQRGLQVIEDGIGPSIIAAEQAKNNVQAIADLGMLLSAPSVTSVTLGTGTKTFIIPENRRNQFAPSVYVMAYAGVPFENAMSGRVVSWNRGTGTLVMSVDQVIGSGTFADWTIGPIATTADLEALRDQVEGDRAASQTARTGAETAVGQAAELLTQTTTQRELAQTARTGSEAALSTFSGIWFGARDTEPTTELVGAQYLDTSQTPNVVKVLTEDGWAPTVTISIGGSRQQAYTATAGQTGPFTVDGGFSVGSVNVNGAELFHGAGVTLDPEAGTFTFAAPLEAGDLVVFRGYLANDVTDIYTKAEADALLAPKLVEADVADRFAKRVRVDAVQAFTEEEQGQGRANLGADILAGFRNKIINGNFDFAQRGTSQSTTGYGSVDRFYLNVGAGSTISMYKAFASGASILGSGGVNTLTLERTATGSEEDYIEQRVENVQTLSGRRATFSVWLRAPLAVSPLNVTLRVLQTFGSGGSGATSVAQETKVVPVGNDFIRYDMVFDFPTVLGKTIGASSYIIVRIILPPASSNARLDTARWSLVEGDATAEADPFSPRHIQQEQALCLRYCELLTQPLACALESGGVTYRIHWLFKVRKRATPSITIGAGSSAAAIATVNTDGVRVNDTTGGIAALNSGTIADAEL